MRFRIFFFCLSVFVVQAGEITKQTLLPARGMTRAELYVVQPVDNPVAVLVLAPGCNGDGKYLACDPSWIDFAKNNRLALVGLSFASTDEDIQTGKGYYYASSGSGTVLLNALDTLFKKPLPLLLYGFSGGAHFTSRFVEWKPERVISWCAYSAGWWDAPHVSTNMPPGIVACGENDERLGASLAYFKQGRAAGKPWLWIEVRANGHTQAKEVDAFVKEYFKTCLSQAATPTTDGTWVDIDSLDVLSDDPTKQNNFYSGWLPRKGLFESWRKLFPVKSSLTKLNRLPVPDSLIEYVVKTENPKQPQITLLMLPPPGIRDMSEVKGVLGLCLLANNVDGIKRRLQNQNAVDDLGGLLRFAEKHQLVILAWGSRSLWDPSKNWDEQKRAITQQMDENFDEIAAAWSRGIAVLAKKYGLPEKNFLLWGISGAGQYAHRLALRKPDRFLAVHVHVPSSFDKPTKEANRVLWCLTTGENEAGYDQSVKFFTACQEMGYPIIYKAIPGLGHKESPVANRIGLAFFEYALSVQHEKEKRNTSLSSGSGQRGTGPQGDPAPAWAEAFRNPPYWGDIINQQIVPRVQRQQIPAQYQVPLPTKAIADAWNSDNFWQPYE
jgi:predicted esterase